MEDFVYVEWVPVGRLVKSLVGFVLCMCLIMTIAVGIQYPFFIVIGASFSAFILFLFLNYQGIQVKMTNKKLLINYGFFNRKSIPIVDVVSCELIKASLRRYGGVGIRYGTDGSRAYTTSLGDAVKISLRKGRPFVFSSNNPEKICSIINHHL